MRRRNPDYRIGYGKPPEETRFQKGKSGNPRGRPAGSKNLSTVIQEALAETVVVIEGGRRVKKTKLEVAFAQLANKAASGDLKAVDMVCKFHAPMNPPADGEVMQGDHATGRNGGEGALDLLKLNDQELEWLEIIVKKAGPK